MGTSVSASVRRIADFVADTRVQSPPYNSGLVLQSFNSWAFKRRQPTEPELLARTVDAAVLELKPLQFVLYWGKGPRSDVDVPERDCLAYIAQMVGRIRAAYAPGAHITLIATDTHARHNGHTEFNIDKYFAQVAKAATQHHFFCVRLSMLVAKERNRVRVDIETPNASILDKLEPCAVKWYRGDNSVAAGAAEYFRMNMLEKRVVELAYPGAIFVTFNSAEYRELFPQELPVFYMYSTRKGNAVKPWFVDVDASEKPADDISMLDGVHPSHARDDL